MRRPSRALVDRIIIIPAEIHYWYYDFFGVNGNAPLQLSQSVFAQLATAHYQTPIAEVIAWKYMGLPVWANVGLFADAYANFGFAGCAVFALLFALVLKTLDAASRATDARVAAALIAVQAFGGECRPAGPADSWTRHGHSCLVGIPCP
jgi:hypothetical protein